MVTDRATQINKIIGARQPLVVEIINVQTNLNKLHGELADLRRVRDTILGSSPELADRLNSIDFDTVLDDIEDEIAALESLRKRFSRNTINIGVIGRARQGKSRLLKSISGLETAIPEGDEGTCTATRSIIRHEPNVDKHGGIVYFYTIEEFLDQIICPYYKKLKLGPCPTSLKEFTNLAEAQLDTEANLALREYTTEVNQLKTYIKMFPRYKGSLGSPPKNVDLEKIQKYVAMYGYDKSGNKEEYYDYFAVKQVEISCDYKHADVGQIALIDMPGLGDTSIGGQEQQIRLLGESADVVLFVKTPKAMGDTWEDADTDLYKMTRDALIEVPIDGWSFMVLNKLEHEKYGYNEQNCNLARSQMPQKGIYVISPTIIADCSKPTEVKNKVLDTILDYLVGNMARLDEQYAKSRQLLLFELQSSIEALLKVASQALQDIAAYRGQDDNQKALFRGVWEKLQIGLEDLVDLLDSEKNSINKTFEAEFKNAIQACVADAANIPSRPLLLDRHKTVGKGDWMILYGIELIELRTRITHHFKPLAEALRRTTNEMKASVAKVFLESGLLNRVVLREGAGALLDMIELMPSNLRIRTAFTDLADFELTYRGFIQYRIREQLDELMGDSLGERKIDRLMSPENERAYRLVNNKNEKDTVTENDVGVDMVYNYLQAAYTQTVFKLETSLDNMLRDPNKVAFAVVEEFTDQVIRAKNADDDWRSFYEKHADRIWPDEFGLLAKQAEARRLWEVAVLHATQVNEASLFRFII